MVMKHLDTGVLSLAIDEFPEVELSERDRDPWVAKYRFFEGFSCAFYVENMRFYL
jgi:hypothetical protein